MLRFQKLLFILVGLNMLACLIFYISTFESPSSISDLRLSTTQDLYTTEQPQQEKKQEPKPWKSKLYNTEPEIPLAAKKVNPNQRSVYKTQPVIDSNITTDVFIREDNPFYMMGGYPEVQLKVPYSDQLEKMSKKVNYGIINEDDYCERVDFYNLMHPENIFEKMNFLSDYADDTVVRRDIIKTIGKDSVPEINKYGATAKLREETYKLDTDINTFFINMDGFHRYHEIGKNFLCATQMYNRIPGSRAMIRKDELLLSLDRWNKNHETRPYCFDKDKFAPKSFRLSIQEECDSFFNVLKSKRYQRSLEQEPIQFIIKEGHGSHSAEGVYLLDEEMTIWMKDEFHSGAKCGSFDTNLIAQTYITNPLLLNNNNKFDFRVYMLVASTNPLIVYYHDGFIRASLTPYDKFSSDRSAHLTNTHLAMDAIAEAHYKNTYNGKTEQQLRDEHIWNFEDLQDYLLDSGKIDDENWLEEYLRPQFKKAMIHLVKMNSQFFLKQSNVYGLFGLDFVLDDNMHLWFIEANPNPQMIGTSKFLRTLLDQMIRSLFEIEYGLYRSRMKRALETIREYMDRRTKFAVMNATKWNNIYREAIKNRFEPEFLMGTNNTFTLVMDESIPGADAYQGNIDLHCMFAH